MDSSGRNWVVSNDDQLHRQAGFQQWVTAIAIQDSSGRTSGYRTAFSGDCRGRQRARKQRWLWVGQRASNQRLMPADSERRSAVSVPGQQVTAGGIPAACAGDSRRDPRGGFSSDGPRAVRTAAAAAVCRAGGQRERWQSVVPPARRPASSVGLSRGVGEVGQHGQAAWRKCRGAGTSGAAGRGRLRQHVGEGQDRSGWERCEDGQHISGCEYVRRLVGCP